jgi:TolA-binding protein
MKKFTILTALVCLSFISFAQSEEDAIKKVVQSETEAYYRRDIQGWKDAWLHDAQIRRTFISTTGGYSTFQGWDSTEAAQERDFKQYATPIPVQIKTANYIVRTNGNMAWVDYDQILNDPTPNSTNGEQKSREYRMLVKENGQWKIASQVTTAVPSGTNSAQAIENNLNMSGYQLLEAKKVNEAIDVFKLNVKLFPDSWNAYDSLGEAYALAGNKKAAIENYEKSVKLNPKSTSGPEALAKLKQK